MAGPEARDFFIVSEWGRRDPAEDLVENTLSSALQRHIIMIKFKGYVLNGLYSILEQFASSQHYFEYQCFRIR